MAGLLGYMNKNHSEDYVLNDTTIVIDATNYFYDKFKNSGSSCERYAAYIKDDLKKYIDANVTCYFIFKGGHEAKETLEKRQNKHLKEMKNTDKPFLGHIFHNEILQQVLRELGFKYAICEYEAKLDVISLATKLNCPILAIDKIYLFAHFAYALTYTVKLNNDGQLMCRVFKKSKFMEKLKLEIDHMSLFLFLWSPYDKDYNGIIIANVRKSLKCKDFDMTLAWLAKTGIKDAKRKILKCLKYTDDKMCIEFEKYIDGIILKAKQKGIILDYFDSDRSLTFSDPDPNWFAKGVCENFIPIPYVNLYRSKLIFRVPYIFEDVNSEDSILLSKHLIRYAFDLLTNFEGGNFNIIARKRDTCYEVTNVTIDEEYSIPKPQKVDFNCIFANGWKNLPPLLDHFLLSRIPHFKLNKFHNLLNNEHLISAALVYISTEIDGDTTDLVHSVLACLTGLQPEVLQRYEALIEKKDMSLLHHLMQFQYCLLYMNLLNALCGNRYEKTQYAKDFDVTLVYNIALKLSEIKDAKDKKILIENILGDNPIQQERFTALIDFNRCSTVSGAC